MVWYESFAAGFHSCYIYFLQFPKQIMQNLFIIPNKKAVNLDARTCIASAFKGPSW